jgi:deoxyribodipyrimidine photolyase
VWLRLTLVHTHARAQADALQRLDEFMAAQLSHYEATRQRADGGGVSKLSPYLHFGQLSVRSVAAALATAGGARVSKTFAHRLAWRDLAYWQLHHFPAITHAPLRAAQLARQPWAPPPLAASHLAAWQAGATGYPLVDAGMRELRATGWMQQSVRMVAASFLVRTLHVPWTEGLAWFHDNLVDADMAINSMMWANCGGACMRVVCAAFVC